MRWSQRCLFDWIDFQAGVDADKLRAKARAQWQWEDTRVNKPNNSANTSTRRNSAKPDTKYYQRVSINSEEKENVSDINIQNNSSTTTTTKPNNKPKPNFANLPPLVNGSAGVRRGSPRRGGRSPRRGGGRGASPRRVAHKQHPSYASTIPPTGLVARLANKILQKWFSAAAARKEYAPVELHTFSYPINILFSFFGFCVVLFFFLHCLVLCVFPFC